MKHQSSNKFNQRAASFGRLILIIFAPFLFLFYWLIVDPRLIYSAQRPVFFYDWSFIKGFFTYHGGPVELLSNFITQFYTSAMLGALLITAVIFVLALGIRKLTNLNSASTATSNFEWLVIVPIAALHVGYLNPMQHTLSLILIIFVFYFYERLTARTGVLAKTIGFIMIAVLLHYLVGALALVLPLFRIIYLKSCKTADMVSVILSFLIVAAVPLLFFQITESDPSRLYTCALPLMLNLMDKLFYLGFWLILFAVLIISRLDKKSNRGFSKLSLLLPAAALLTAVIAISLTFQPEYKTVLRVNALADQRQWQPLLNLLDKHRDLNHRLTNLQRYRALYFTGRLGDRLFAFPHEGADGLYRSDKVSYEFPIEYCDLLTDLGNVNGALHKAYEAWAVEGETPRVLQRLGYLHLAKKEFPAAEKYLLKLKQTGKNRKWVLQHLNYCRNHSFGTDSDLLRLFQFIGRADFLMRPGFANAELKEIARVQPSRMAVEYLLSHDLLSGHLDLFMENLPMFLQITPDLPRAFEEAVVLYLNSGLPVTEAQRSIAVRRSTVQSFERFMQIMQKYGNDKRRAFNELQQSFGDSFWFYFLYLNKGEAK